MGERFGIRAKERVVETRSEAGLRRLSRLAGGKALQLGPVRGGMFIAPQSILRINQLL